MALAFDGSFASVVGWLPNLTLIASDVFRLFLVDTENASLLLWMRGERETAGMSAAHNYLFMPQIWSLSVEITFYAVVPILNILKSRTLLVLLAASVSVIVQCVIEQYASLQFRHLLFVYNMGYFITGMLAHRAMTSVSSLPKSILVLCAGLPITIAILWPIIIPSLHQLLAPMPKTAKLLGIWGVYFGFAAGLPALFLLTRVQRWDQKLGNYSYPVYLCHFLFAVAWRPLGNGAALSVFVAAMGLSWILIKLIDEPIDQWRQRRLGRDRDLDQACRSTRMTSGLPPAKLGTDLPLRQG